MAIFKAEGLTDITLRIVFRQNEISRKLSERQSLSLELNTNKLTNCEWVYECHQQDLSKQTAENHGMR